jgi:two-component system probable response regulator PhcQ
MSAPVHTVLFVDDEPEIIDSLRRTLRDESYRILGTTSPADALDILDRETVDLLIADIDMPDINGLELVARVRRTHPEVVRMLLTGDASLESALEAINEGEVHRYLTKPWNKDELRETIRQTLARVDELRRLAAADRLAQGRERILSELEKTHSNIRAVELDDGVYVIDDSRLSVLLSELHSPVMTELFELPTVKARNR